MNECHCCDIQGTAVIDTQGSLLTHLGLCGISTEDLVICNQGRTDGLFIVDFPKYKSLPAQFLQFKSILYAIWNEGEAV